jgi:hypothetical protein
MVAHLLRGRGSSLLPMRARGRRLLVRAAGGRDGGAAKGAGRPALLEDRAAARADDVKLRPTGRTNRVTLLDRSVTGGTLEPPCRVEIHDAENLRRRTDSTENLRSRIIEHGRHPLFFGEHANRAFRCLLLDQLLDSIRHFENLVAARSPGESTVAADRAAASAPQRLAGRKTEVLAHVLRRRGRLCARRTHPPNQTLCHDREEGRTDRVRVDAELEQSGDGGGGVVGVNGREHEMTGLGRLEGDQRRLVVADLAHEDYVGILA